MSLSRPLLAWRAWWIVFTTALPVLGGPLDSWTIVPSPATNHLRAVVFGGGLFVAAGDAGTVLVSSNGLAWTAVSTGIKEAIRGMTYGQGRFVGVGSSGRVITSGDGLAWEQPGSGTSNQLNAVVASELGFVAAGNAGTILTSSDGSNWVVQVSGTAASMVGLGTAFGRVYAGAAVNSPALFWSTNGAMWAYLTNGPPSGQPDLFNGGFAYGHGALVGIRVRGLFARSADGDTWASLTSPFVYCFGLTYARDTFVTVGGNFSSDGRTIGTSADGITWETRYSRTSEGRLLSVAYGKHRFVAVGDNGAIVISAPLLWLSNPSWEGGRLHLALHGEPGAVYHIESATNFSSASWSAVALVTNLTDPTEIDVSLAAGSPAVFFRLSAE